jgi:hypothetical protein
VVVDPRSTEAVVTFDGARVLDGFYLALPGEPLTAGTRWATWTRGETPTPACRRLVG